MLFIMYVQAKNRDISETAHEFHKTISVSRKCIYTKVLFSIKERGFNTCFLLIFGSTERAGPDAAAEACSGLEKSRASHGWNLYHILTVVHFGCCNPSLTVLPSCALWKSQLCAAISPAGRDVTLAGWLHIVSLETWSKGCNWFKGCNASAPGPWWTVPDGFCTSGIHLCNGFVQWPTAAKLTDQSTKTQWRDCQLFRGRQIALKGFMGRAMSPSSSGWYSSSPSYNAREREWEKMCLFQTLTLRCNGRWCHPAQQQELYFSVLTLGEKTWEWAVVQNLAYAEKRWEQCKPHGKQTYSCSAAKRMKVNCNYIKPIFPLGHTSHSLAAKRGLKEGAEAVSGKASWLFLTVLTLSCVFVSGAARKRRLEDKTISRI